MAVYVKSRTIDPKTQTYPLVKVSTYITNLSGDLLIDDPKNKSGLRKFPEYPIFNSKNVLMRIGRNGRYTMVSIKKINSISALILLH